MYFAAAPWIIKQRLATGISNAVAATAIHAAISQLIHPASLAPSVSPGLLKHLGFLIIFLNDI